MLAQKSLIAMCFPCVQILPPTKNEVKSGKWTTLGLPIQYLHRITSMDAVDMRARGFH